MKVINNTIARIEPLKQDAVNFVRNKIDKTMTRAGSWGDLEDLLLRYVGITGQLHPTKPEKLTVIACADHGVAEMNVSAYPQETTAHMVRNYVESKGAVANAMSNFCKSTMIVVDMGVKVDMSDLPNIIHHRIAPGTQNIAKGPAMTIEQAIEAINTGINIANAYAKKGYRCFLPGEMGIANTTSSAAIVAALCQLTPEEATGRGTNISDKRLAVKIKVVRQALMANKLMDKDTVDAASGVEILAAIGGFELGCITGLILGAAANNSFVVLDGFNTGAAALIAQKLYPNIADYVMASHIAAEPAHVHILKKLNLKPYMNFNFRLGEATGSSIAVSLLDCAIEMYAGLEYISRNPQKVTLRPARPNITNVLDNVVKNEPFPEYDIMMDDSCRDRINNLTKPIYSLGAIEEFAWNLAGIKAEACPTHINKKIVVITSPESCSSIQHALTMSAASYAEAKYHFITVPDPYFNSQLEFIFLHGVLFGEQLEDTDVLSVCFSEAHPNEICGSLELEAVNRFLKPHTNELRYTKKQLMELPDDDLSLRMIYAIGIIIGAASKRIAIVSDDIVSEIALRYAQMLQKELRDFCFTLVPKYLDLNVGIGGGIIAAISMKVLDASMQMMRDMKTFAEAGVAIANDGPGKGLQRDTD